MGSIGCRPGLRWQGAIAASGCYEPPGTTQERAGLTLGAFRIPDRLLPYTSRMTFRRRTMLVLACWFAPTLLTAQATASTPPSPEKIEAAARRITAAAKFATFVTLDDTGAPRARTVQPLAPDSTWTVWFATNPRTRKVQDITRDGRVVLHWFDAPNFAYVALTGRARIVRSRAEKDAHWDPAWNAFYTERDTSVVLVAVTATHLEVVSAKDGVEGDKATWRPPVLRPKKR